MHILVSSHQTTHVKTNRLYPSIKSNINIQKLFGGNGTKAVTSFPLRVVYTQTERRDDEEPVQLLFSVSKRFFKRAVKRNRIKRQMREAVRLNIRELLQRLPERADTTLLVAFIWIADREYTTAEVSKRIVKALSRVAANLQAPQAENLLTGQTRDVTEPSETSCSPENAASGDTSPHLTTNH